MKKRRWPKPFRRRVMMARRKKTRGWAADLNRHRAKLFGEFESRDPADLAREYDRLKREPQFIPHKGTNRATRRSHAAQLRRLTRAAMKRKDPDVI